MSRRACAKATTDWPAPLHILEGDADKFAAFDAADVALAASGTVTTELALSRTPMVMAYKLGWLTYNLMRPFVHAPFGTLVNVILDREAVPEFVQGTCTAEGSGRCALPTLLIRQRAACAPTQRADLDEATEKLGAGGERAEPAARREALLAFMRADVDASNRPDAASRML